MRVRAPAEAVAALLRERNRLLKLIARKQQEFAGERQQQQVLAQTLFAGIQPLVEERTNLISEVRRLFAELLVEGRLSRSAHSKVSEIFQSLKESGELDSRDEDGDGNGDDDTCWDYAANAAQDAAEGRRPDHTESGAPSPGDRTVGSAIHGGGRPGNESLRAVFRRLIMALHPDLARDGDEQQRRTDIMKEVTRAYEEGDIARLLVIEQQWLATGAVQSSQLDEVKQCAALERTVQELGAQERALVNQLKALKKSSPLATLFGTRRVSRDVRAQQVEMYLHTARTELEPLRQIRDYVKAFSERKMSLAEFLRGPRRLRVDAAEISEALLSSLLQDLGVGFGADASGRKRRGRARGRRGAVMDDFEDIPF